MTDVPERKHSAEAARVQQMKRSIWEGDSPIPADYPYVLPDYALKFKHIGTEKQLFLDNYILDDLAGVVRQPETPEKHPAPVLRQSELPWEREIHYSTVLFEEATRTFRMWYSTSLTNDSARQRLCYAESADGIHWNKPLDRPCVPFEQYDRTNIVHDNACLPCVIRNPDMRDAERTYFLTYYDYAAARQRGKKIVFNVAYSPDGYTWTDMAADCPYPLQHNPCILYDPAIEKYVAYAQHSHHWHWEYPYRQIGRQESDDLIRWTPKEVVMTAEDNGNLDPNVEFHTACVFKADSLYIGMIDVCRADPAWQHRNGRNWRDYFYLQSFLATSRDGKRWTMLGDMRKPWVENGPPGSADFGYLGFHNRPVYFQGKMYFYYTAVNHKQGINEWTGLNNSDIAVPGEVLTGTFMELNKEDRSRIKHELALFTLREDGYMSLRPAYEEGYVYTVQFVFEGSRLLLNADVGYGYIKVAILNARMEPYEGFSLEDCGNVYGAGIWHEVQWKGGADVSGLWNKPVRLHIYLQHCRIFAFRFADR